MPTNLYGPRDNFNPESAHVLPALVHRFHQAKIQDLKNVFIWGDGTPMREFLHVEDLARACLTLIHDYDDSIAINVGSGEEISIRNLASLIAQIIGFDGEITFDLSRPNGTPRKFLDSSRIIQLGWGPKVGLAEGIASTYDWFLAQDQRGTFG